MFCVSIGISLNLEIHSLANMLYLKTFVSLHETNHFLLQFCNWK